MEISGTNCMQVWKKLLEKAMSTKNVFQSGNRSCLELTGVHITVSASARISEPARFLARQDKWIYPDLHEIAEIILDKNLASNYTYSYANRIFGDPDQINDYVIPILKKNPNSRRAVVTLSVPTQDQKKEYTETPSIMVIDFKLREEKLQVHAFIRSCDLFVGFPANIYQLHMLQSYVAKQLATSLGDLHVYCSSGHIFEDQISDIRQLLH